MPWSSERITIGGFERVFEVYQQESRESCGPACVVMVNYLKFGDKTAETIVKVWFAQAENRGGLPGAPKGTAPANRVLNWRGVSMADTILRVLQARKIGARPTLTTDIRGAANCTPHMPGIMRVQWARDDGAGGANLAGGHFVVCLGQTSGNIWTYLDPNDGVVLMPAAPPYYVSGQNMGIFTHLIST